MGGGFLRFRLFRELAQLASLGAPRLGCSLPATRLGVDQHPANPQLPGGIEQAGGQQ